MEVLGPPVTYLNGASEDSDTDYDSSVSHREDIHAKITYSLFDTVTWPTRQAGTRDHLADISKVSCHSSI